MAGDAEVRAHDVPVALRIALPPPEPKPAVCVRAHPDLAEAARWFLAHNALRPLTGFAVCKERARYRCENPDCGRPTLLVEGHHLHWRVYGGSDDPANGVSLCASCHARNVHTRKATLRVTRVQLEGLETLFWEYPDRAPVLRFREWPPPGAEDASSGGTP